MEIEQAKSQRAAIIDLLSAEKLPTNDLPVSLNNFIISKENGELIGVVGLEVYGNNGLVRSLAVSRDHRNKGIAAKLLIRIEAIAALKPLKELYLLTESASNYFERKGYKKITRTEVPAELMMSSEFSHVCPASAIIMRKLLTKV